MSTVAISCPNCNASLRVSVQPSIINVMSKSMFVTFDSQTVAHVCKKKEAKT